MLAPETDLVRPVGHPETNLGGDDEVLARLALEPAPDNLLGGTAPVDIGRVDEVAAGRREMVKDGVAGGLVGLAAEGHRPEAERADVEAGPAEKAIFHLAPLLVRWPVGTAHRRVVSLAGAHTLPHNGPRCRSAGDAQWQLRLRE